MDDIFKGVCLEKLVNVNIPSLNRCDTNNVITYGRIGDSVEWMNLSTDSKDNNTFAMQEQVFMRIKFKRI